MKLPGEQKWSLGCCSCLLDWRSYEVQVDGRCFRRNHPQLSSTLKPSPVPSSNNEEPHQTENESRSPHQTENESRSAFCQSLYQTSAKPHRLLGFRRMTHCSPHTLSQTAQIQSQFSDLNALGELDIPQPGSRIMTYVEHLNIDLSLPLSYSIIICCCCCCQCCNGKGCGVTCVTIVMWSASHTNRRAPWYLSRHKQKPEQDVKKFCCSLTCSSVILLSPKLHSRKYWKLHGMSSM